MNLLLQNALGETQIYDAFHTAFNFVAMQSIGGFGRKALSILKRLALNQLLKYPRISDEMKSVLNKHKATQQFTAQF